MEEENKSIDSIPVKDENGRKLHTRTCPRCKQPYQTKIGVDNWKNLFKAPSVEDWITLVILGLLIFAAYAYTLDTKTCKDVIKNIDSVCLNRSMNSKVNYTGFGVPYIGNENYTYNNSNESTLEVNSSNDSGQNTVPYNYSTNQTQNLTNASK